ncbi:hypothetical protein H696_01552 [Fonticula alba]|uniref:HTH myb-type domain-containing protein n=1 Tax=Fonticula alba TaxID=691883 RepID=A0A058ZDZ7_FONAL|nr:hypothetical protein H696_01552 [Fonticula alba]KCV72148.1 hypothetical protein H696_01552 [Fonticula alba]|eukprot:XP_009493726.1 hypothetical protein H696_01552 [Fonticula alba]
MLASDVNSTLLESTQPGLSRRIRALESLDALSRARKGIGYWSFAHLLSALRTIVNEIHLSSIFYNPQFVFNEQSNLAMMLASLAIQTFLSVATPDIDPPTLQQLLAQSMHDVRGLFPRVVDPLLIFISGSLEHASVTKTMPAAIVKLQSEFLDYNAFEMACLFMREVLVEITNKDPMSLSYKPADMHGPPPGPPGPPLPAMGESLPMPPSASMVAGGVATSPGGVAGAFAGSPPSFAPVLPAPQAAAVPPPPPPPQQVPPPPMPLPDGPDAQNMVGSSLMRHLLSSSNTPGALAEPSSSLLSSTKALRDVFRTGHPPPGGPLPPGVARPDGSLFHRDHYIPPGGGTVGPDGVGVPPGVHGGDMSDVGSGMRSPGAVLPPGSTGGSASTSSQGGSSPTTPLSASKRRRAGKTPVSGGTAARGGTTSVNSTNNSSIYFKAALNSLSSPSQATSTSKEKDKASSPAPQRRTNPPFSKEEETKLVDGYRRYGPAWTKILKEYDFPTYRTSVDLKDKFRNLSNRGYLPDDVKAAYLARTAVGTAGAQAAAAALTSPVATTSVPGAAGGAPGAGAPSS